MKITKTSLLTGIKRTLEIPIEQEDYNDYLAGESLDLVAPYLTKADADFIKSGVTDEDLEQQIYPQFNEKSFNRVSANIPKYRD
jgi:hypothetical protein